MTFRDKKSGTRNTMNPKIIFRGKLSEELSEKPQYVWITPKLEVAIFKSADKISVFPSLCPHMGAQLQVSHEKLVCPWHGLEFCQKNKTSNHFRYKNIDSFPAEIINNEIFIYEKNHF